LSLPLPLEAFELVQRAMESAFERSFVAEHKIAAPYGPVMATLAMHGGVEQTSVVPKRGLWSVGSLMISASAPTQRLPASPTVERYQHKYPLPNTTFDRSLFLLR